MLLGDIYNVDSKLTKYLALGVWERHFRISSSKIFDYMTGPLRHGIANGRQNNVMNAVFWDVTPRGSY
jgi:hypothetical protein